MIEHLIINQYETIAVILFGIGFTNLLLNKNMIKKIIGFNIMDNAVYLFLAAKGYVDGRVAPIIVDGVQDMEAYVNPIPAGLVLTGIVVSVSVTAIMLSLTIKLYRRYHTLDIDEIACEKRRKSEWTLLEIFLFSVLFYVWYRRSLLLFCQQRRQEDGRIVSW